MQPGRAQQLARRPCDSPPRRPTARGAPLTPWLVVDADDAAARRRRLCRPAAGIRAARSARASRSIAWHCDALGRHCAFAAQDRFADERERRALAARGDAAEDDQRLLRRRQRLLALEVRRTASAAALVGGVPARPCRTGRTRGRRSSASALGFCSASRSSSFRSAAVAGRSRRLLSRPRSPEPLAVLALGARARSCSRWSARSRLLPRLRPGQRRERVARAPPASAAATPLGRLGDRLFGVACVTSLTAMPALAAAGGTGGSAAGVDELGAAAERGVGERRDEQRRDQQPSSGSSRRSSRSAFSESRNSFIAAPPSRSRRGVVGSSSPASCWRRAAAAASASVGVAPAGQALAGGQHVGGRGDRARQLSGAAAAGCRRRRPVRA